MERGKLGGWWRLWIVLSLAWIALMLFLGLASVRWPKVDDLRLQRVSAACTVDENGQQLVLNRIYTEPKLRETGKDQKYAGEPWWPEMQRCLASLDVDYAAVRRAEAIGVFIPMLLVIFLPPTFLLLAGLALSWIGKGFRSGT